MHSETIHRRDYLIGSFTGTYLYFCTGIRQVILKSVMSLQHNLYVGLVSVIHIAGRLLNERSGVRVWGSRNDLGMDPYEDIMVLTDGSEMDTR